MPLVFHEMGHNPAGKVAGASVEVFLKFGLMSKAMLRKIGKLPPVEDQFAYEKALQRRENWIKERKEVLRDEPDLLRAVLASDKESNWVDGFNKPGDPAHREENVFFLYSNHPSSNRDWVAIEVPDTTTLHDASCRDYCKHEQWFKTAVTIWEFKEILAMGRTPTGWNSLYNEHLIHDKVPAEKIVAYAKIEKELPFKNKITLSQLHQIQIFVSKQLNFATQFPDPVDNVLLHEQYDRYQIRISLNKNKVMGRESEISEFFSQFKSIEALIKVANNGETCSQNSSLICSSSDFPSTSAEQSVIKKNIFSFFKVFGFQKNETQAEPPVTNNFLNKP